MPGHDPIPVPLPSLREHLARLCPRSGIDLAGVLPLPAELPHARAFSRWLASGRHGGLEYMRRDPGVRLDPTIRHRDACSLLIFAQGYTRGWPTRDTDPSAGGKGRPDLPWTTRVSRYARGCDYHDVLLKAVRATLGGLAEVWPDLWYRASTDTGPYLEREYAWLAGLGFLGRNMCLIHERLGSGLFLGVALTNLHIEGHAGGEDPVAQPLYGVVPRRTRPPARAYLSACGSCTRCLEACPTGALSAEDGLDARRCISTWTIEHRGQVPTDMRRETGGILFGCDICQAVCPWNSRASGRALPPVDPAYEVLPAHADIGLADLVDMTDAEFRARFRRTPLWRCHPEGLRRNARRVLEEES